MHCVIIQYIVIQLVDDFDNSISLIRPHSDEIVELFFHHATVRLIVVDDWESFSISLLEFSDISSL
jgi:hypothetical protein